MAEDSSEQGSPEPGASERRGFDRGRITDSLHEQYPDDPKIQYVVTDDGLATAAHAQGPSYAPPLTEDTLVCMADKRSFVLRDAACRVVFEVSEDAVTELPDGRFYVAYMTAIRSLGSSRSLAGFTAVARAWTTEGVEVHPVRPQCAHYARQQVELDGTGHLMTERLCTARRDDDGAFLSVMDQAIYACELRSPADMLSRQRINSFDEDRVRQGHQRMAEDDDVFDVDKCLAELRTSAGNLNTGIFGDK
jgi:hypothetical protein